jgi:hypothetical protein
MNEQGMPLHGRLCRGTFDAHNRISSNNIGRYLSLATTAKTLHISTARLSAKGK